MTPTDTDPALADELKGLTDALDTLDLTALIVARIAGETSRDKRADVMGRSLVVAWKAWIGVGLLAVAVMLLLHAVRSPESGSLFPILTLMSRRAVGQESLPDAILATAAVLPSVVAALLPLARLSQR